MAPWTAILSTITGLAGLAFCSFLVWEGQTTAAVGIAAGILGTGAGATAARRLTP